MHKSLTGHVFVSGLEDKQRKCETVYSSHNEMKDSIDGPSSARFVNVLNRESSVHEEEPSSSRLEDNYRRKHYERQIRKIRSELMEEEQNLVLKGCVEGKNQALLQFQNVWCRYSPTWKELERYSDFLARKKQDDERKAIETAQSIMPFEYEHFEPPLQSLESKNLYPAEKDSVLFDKSVNDRKYRKHGAVQKQYSIDQFTNKTAGTCRIEHDKKSHLLSLLKEFDCIYKKFQYLQRNLTQIKNDREILDIKLMELNREMGNLKEQKEVLETTLLEYKEKEKLFQNEIKPLSSHMEKLKFELRKCKAYEDVCGATNQPSENIAETAMESGEMKHVQYNEKNNPIFKQYALEIQLLQDIHKEEIQLYKLQLAQATQQIRDLQAQIHHNTNKKRHRSKYETQNCHIRNNNLVSDGTGNCKQEVRLMDVNEYRKSHDNHRKIGVFSDERLCCENRASSDIIGNEFQVESALRNLNLDQFNAFEQEMFNVIGEKVKQNVFNVSDKLMALENNNHEMISAMRTGVDDQVHVDRLENSTVSKIDCGTGMAFSFYYGYLKLILPVGSSTLGIKRRILKYIKDENLSDNAFPMKKLIILIPQNSYIPTSLQEFSIDDPGVGNKYWIESVKSLAPEIIERNGWKRDFHLPVYRIKDPNSESGSGDYVVAEFATPVKVLNDIIHKCPVPKISEVFKIHQQEIISSFHKSLLERIRKNNDGCKDLCEIIYYPDTDEIGKRVNIGRIILDRIRLRNTSDSWK